MALGSINKPNKDSGFTIVELLIVIVVIAILATISIVAYSGIQSRARDTKAQANATQAQKIAEAYYADNSVYPTTTAMFTTATTKLPSNLTILTGAISTIPSLSATNGENSLIYRYVGTAPNATGACIYFWDFAPTSQISSPILMGNATASNCSYTTGTSGNTPTS